MTSGHCIGELSGLADMNRIDSIIKIVLMVGNFGHLKAIFNRRYDGQSISCSSLNVAIDMSVVI